MSGDAVVEHESPKALEDRARNGVDSRRGPTSTAHLVEGAWVKWRGEHPGSNPVRLQGLRPRPTAACDDCGARIDLDTVPWIMWESEPIVIRRYATVKDPVSAMATVVEWMPWICDKCFRKRIEILVAGLRSPTTPPPAAPAPQVWRADTSVGAIYGTGPTPIDAYDSLRETDKAIITRQKFAHLARLYTPKS